MKVVALISGGKDSTYNIMQCIAAGHTIVALANLQPANKGELDSYMYQSVGHEGINYVAKALGLPLYQRITHGKAKHQDKDYVPTNNDEVEDLFELLQSIKLETDYDAVAVGAILSDYQRIRVENICSRLGLISLAYLWRRNQSELLNEMIECGVQAVLVKVAALGLEPSRHLGMSLSTARAHLQRMNEKYGLHVCGEGGEYETFTLDCPLYTNTIVVNESETVIHSNDAIAPVGYLHLKELVLNPKDCVPTDLQERLKGIPIKDPLSFTADIDVEENQITNSEEEDGTEENKENDAEEVIVESSSDNSVNVYVAPVATGLASAAYVANFNKTAGGWLWIGNISGESDNPIEAITSALEKLQYCLEESNYTIQDVCAVTMYISDMQLYCELNKIYCETFKYSNPPVRVCVQCPLYESTPVLFDALAYSKKKRKQHVLQIDQDEIGDGDLDVKQVEVPNRVTMHVQGISHWAPANIGPYSQAIQVGDIIRVAGQIGLVPGTLELISGGVLRQCRISLRHIGRIVAALDSNMQLRDVVQGVCYVTDPNYIEIARNEWEKRTNNAIVDYLVVSNLPKSALIEWHFWAHRHNNQFEYEETGQCIENYLISIRRRFNYENEVAAVVCHVQEQQNPVDSTPTDEPPTTAALSTELILKCLEYALSKLNQNYIHEPEQPPLCNLRFFYPINNENTINVSDLHELLQENRVKYNIVYTVIPVCQLRTQNTRLSICGVRYE